MAMQPTGAGRQPEVSAWSPIRFAFDQTKAIEAVATLLRTAAGGRMPYMRLVKLLYLADRESLHRYGRPIVGGRYVAMKLGPVPSEVLDAIKRDEPDSWQRHIEREGYDVRLKKAPEIRLLSDAEVTLLEETADLFRRLDQWALGDITHALPEWNDPGTSATEIAPEMILKALQKSEEQIEEIRAEALEAACFDKMFPREDTRP